jgi:hypothetical protein
MAVPVGCRPNATTQQIAAGRAFFSFSPGLNFIYFLDGPHARPPSQDRGGTGGAGSPRTRFFFGESPRYPGRHCFMCNESLELAAPQYTAVKT